MDQQLENHIGTAASKTDALPAAAAASPQPPPAAPAAGRDDLREQVIAAIQEVYDPEIPVNIWELGLIYDIEVEKGRDIKVKMTLTSPACPAAQDIPGRVRASIGRVPGVGEVDVEIVWDPPWTPAKMSEIAKLELGMF